MDYQTLVAQSYKAMDERQIDQFKTYFADKLIWVEAEGFPYGGVYYGIDQVVEKVHSRLGSEWIDYKANPLSYLENGQEVVVYGQYSGTYAKTGKSFLADFAHFYHFDESGKVSHFRQVVDSGLVTKAMQ